MEVLVVVVSVRNPSVDELSVAIVQRDNLQNRDADFELCLVGKSLIAIKRVRGGCCCAMRVVVAGKQQ